MNDETTEANENIPDESSDEVTPDLSAKPSHRTEARVNVDRPALIRLTSGKTVKAKLVNLSCGGLAFEYPAPANAGATLTLFFQLSGENALINIQVEGVVKHSHMKNESFITGVQFTNIAEEHMDIIESFVEFKISSASQLSGFAVSYRNKG